MPYACICGAMTADEFGVAVRNICNSSSGTKTLNPAEVVDEALASVNAARIAKGGTEMKRGECPPCRPRLIKQVLAIMTEQSAQPLKVA